MQNFRYGKAFLWLLRDLKFWSTLPTYLVLECLKHMCVSLGKCPQMALCLKVDQVFFLYFPLQRQSAFCFTSISSSLSLNMMNTMIIPASLSLILIFVTDAYYLIPWAGIWTAPCNGKIFFGPIIRILGKDLSVKYISKS